MMIDEELPLVRVLTCGSVDDGKSTLIGRLLYDSKALLADQLTTLESDSKTHGTVENNGLDFALLLDGLIAEREQGITIDVAYRFFSTDQCHFIIADTPGHEQYTRNMATGASSADAAILLIDARSGVITQTRRHAQILSLLGVKQIVLAVNKMDLVDFDQQVFTKIVTAFKAFAKDLGFSTIHAIPISARDGDNIFNASSKAPWYQDATLIDWLHTLPARTTKDAKANPSEQAFSLPIQWVNRPNLDFRGFCGTIASGKVKIGDNLIAQPTHQQAKVASIFIGDQSLTEAEAGQAITLTLDREIDVSRGDVLSTAESPFAVSDQFSAFLIWMDETPMLPERRYLFKSGTRQISGAITALKYRLDVERGEQHAASQLELNEIAEVNLSLDRPLVYEPYQDNHRLGAFIVVDRVTNATVGAGMLNYGLRRAETIPWQTLSINRKSRASLKNQKPLVLWFTGLSGSGKSTIANLLEQKLFDGGYHTMLLDGDNVRHGLNRDLGFTDTDRVENIRRVAEVSALMTEAGLITLVAFISPFKAERRLARDLLNNDEFKEIYIDTSLTICEERDVKGLYARARAGDLPNFTGISSDYEPPESPEIHIKTDQISAEDAAELIFNALKSEGYLI